MIEHRNSAEIYVSIAYFYCFWVCSTFIVCDVYIYICIRDGKNNKGTGEYKTPTPVKP